jgi:hypothetical protein
MAQFFNQHSFVLSALGLWGGLALFLRRDGFSRRDWLALATVAGSLAFAWLLLRPGPSAYQSTAQVEAVVGHGQPVLVEFYSNY